MVPLFIFQQKLCHIFPVLPQMNLWNENDTKKNGIGEWFWWKKLSTGAPKRFDINVQTEDDNIDIQSSNFETGW